MVAKGLDWFRVASDIAHDGDLEYVSDACFRTFVELIGLCSERLSDGHLCVRDAFKMCNTRRVGDTLRALNETGHIILEDDSITIPAYTKWQQTAAEVAANRGNNSERIAKWRDRCKGVTPPVTNGVGNTPQSKSKSKSKKEEKNIVAESPVDNLVELALVELPESQSAPVDYFRTIDRYRSKLSDEHIERIIVDLANWRPKNPIDWKEKKAHLTLAKWLNKEPRDPLPPSHVPAKLPEYDGTEIPMPAEIKLMIENVGRKM